MDHVRQMLGSDADLLCIEFDLPVISEVLFDSNEEFLGYLSVTLLFYSRCFASPPSLVSL